MPTKIVLDCDPGHDEAVAMLLAHCHPEIELLAVTTVGGNQTLTKVTRNALSVETVAGITGVPFAAGASRSLVRPVAVAADVRGDTGLDGVDLPDPSFDLDPRHGVQLIIDTVMAHEPGTVTLVPTGPLTDIALAARLAPEIIDRVREVALMRGGYHEGNWSPVAEFNGTERETEQAGQERAAPDPTARPAGPVSTRSGACSRGWGSRGTVSSPRRG